MHLYSVTGSGHIECRTYVQSKTLFIVAENLLDAAHKFENENPTLKVWNVAHKGKIDAVSAAAYASLMFKEGL